MHVLRQVKGAGRVLQAKETAYMKPSRKRKTQWIRPVLQEAHLASLMGWGWGEGARPCVGHQLSSRRKTTAACTSVVTWGIRSGWK